MAAMSYLLRHPKTGVYYYRRPLPLRLKGQPVPAHWPQTLSDLVSPTARRFKSDLKLSLGTKDPKEAKRRCSLKNAAVQDLYDEAERLLIAGPRAPTEAEIQRMAERVYIAELAADDQARDEAGQIQSSGDATAHREGFAHVLGEELRADSEMYRRAAATRDRGLVEAEVRAALRREGYSLPEGHPARDALGKAILGAYVRAQDGLLRRHAGDDIPTPSLAAVIPGPKLSEALAMWAKGGQGRGAKKPSPNSATEAAQAVRWFTDLHGDLPIADIRRAHARTFRDETARVPRALPVKLRRLPIPALLERLPADSTPRSATSVNKHLSFLRAIVARAASDSDLVEAQPGWSNPFAGISIGVEEGGADQRLPFDPEDLRAIFSSPAITGEDRPAAAQGEAAKWFPLIGLFTGARLDEIGQLRVMDLQQAPGGGPWFFDFTDLGEGQKLKTGAKGRKRVPVHPELVRCGLLDFHAARARKVRRDGPLFPGFAPNASGKWTAAWSKWFGRYLRGTVGIMDRRKVFHSFRHTFKDAAREAGIPTSIHDKLTGHSSGSVGEGYGLGLSVESLAVEVGKISYRGLDLSPLYSASEVISQG